MTLNELKTRAKEGIVDAWNIGYREGLREASAKIRFIAAEVNVSAEQLRAEIEAEAKRLEKLGREVGCELCEWRKLDDYPTIPTWCPLPDAVP